MAAFCGRASGAVFHYWCKSSGGYAATCDRLVQGEGNRSGTAEWMKHDKYRDAMLQAVAEPLTGLADTAFVARLGSTALAALGVGTIVLSGSFWIFNFLGIGTQTEVAQSLGSRRLFFAPAAGAVERFRTCWDFEPSR